MFDPAGQSRPSSSTKSLSQPHDVEVLGCVVVDVERRTEGRRLVGLEQRECSSCVERSALTRIWNRPMSRSRSPSGIWMTVWAVIAAPPPSVAGWPRVRPVPRIAESPAGTDPPSAVARRGCLAQRMDGDQARPGPHPFIGDAQPTRLDGVHRGAFSHCRRSRGPPTSGRSGGAHRVWREAHDRRRTAQRRGA